MYAMPFVEEGLPGVKRLRLKRLDDSRGSFVKTYGCSLYEADGIHFDFREEFYSISAENVVRGMHFQIPPYDHDKMVYCAIGAVEDVLLDLRKGQHYGMFCSFVLSEEEPDVLFIPRGIAHGFKALCNGSLMVYKTSAEYAPTHDSGIRWDSFDYDWKIDAPIVSARDLSHQAFSDFVTPFADPY